VTTWNYGDVDNNGYADMADILCELDAFAGCYYDCSCGCICSL
jgi:hypothetical protein